MLLSICIPTNGVVEWVMPVLESIYSQGVDNRLFEVVVTDNGGTPDLGDAVRELDYLNFHFYKTSSQGFKNQIDAFEKCNGVFCKMLNHRSKLMPGSLEALLKLIIKYQETKPIIYCAEGHVKGGEYIECANTDEFVKSLGIWTSWSCGTGAWKVDLKDIRNKNVDDLFSHSVFLFDLRDESKYVIWNGEYEVQASDKGKGGYDVFYAFSVRILDIISDLRRAGRVTEKTFVAVKKETFDFLAGIYYHNNIRHEDYSFKIQNIRQNMGVYYGNFYYCKMILKAWWMVPNIFIASLVRKIFKH